LGAPGGTAPAPTRALVELDHVDKWFGDLHVLRDIELSVGAGEVVVVIGPSGSGKSTLCRTINRLEPIHRGEIRIDGTVLPEEGKALAALRADVGMVFQSFNLFAHKSILDNVTLGPLKARRLPKREAHDRAMELLARVGIASWVFSAVFHTRDFQATEELDYFAAGANVLYGMYYTPIRVFRLDRNTPRRRSLLRVWSLLCASLYLCHVAYLKLVRWDYTYNMAANVAAGVVQNILWSWFSYNRYRTSRRTWAIWPGLVVAWVMFAMSMELFDFPPWLGCIDAHSLWHLMTIGPTLLWYKYVTSLARLLLP